MYAGRVCSAELMGCEKCNFHGACTDHIDENGDTRGILCDCFQWYAGEKCQFNLKGNDFHTIVRLECYFIGIMFFTTSVLLVGLIALGGILFALLLICIMMICWKHNNTHRRRRTMVPGIDILPHKTLTVHGGSSKTGTLQDRRAMIEDTSSETSEDSLQLPYITKKVCHTHVHTLHLYLKMIHLKRKSQQIFGFS